MSLLWLRQLRLPLALRTQHSVPSCPALVPLAGLGSHTQNTAYSDPRNREPSHAPILGRNKSEEMTLEDRITEDVIRLSVLPVSRRNSRPTDGADASGPRIGFGRGKSKHLVLAGFGVDWGFKFQSRILKGKDS